MRVWAMALGCCAMLTSWPGGWRAAADDRGMVGIVFRQIYSDRVPNHRGPMVALQILDGSPAAKAGMHCSDFVIAVNGTPVMGRDYLEILKKEIEGPIGGSVRLSIVRYDGSQQELTLVRAAFPPHVTAAGDAIRYRVPGSWRADPRYEFPLSWAPKLAYHGFEDLFFAPNFDDTNSPEYHSYLFFLWVEGTEPVTAGRLESDMLVYFRGLAEERGKNYEFTPDLAKVGASYREDEGRAGTFGGAAARKFSGTVTIWDTHGKLITLNSEVVAAVCPGSNHTAMFFGMSLEPRGTGIWKELDEVRDTFQCGGK